MDKLHMLKEKIISFRKERDWEQYHNLKDLAISLSLEASEVLELFQWKTTEEINRDFSEKIKTQLEHEIADVAIYLLLICNEAEIDIADAIDKKIEINKQKYPVETFKGSTRKYNDK